MDRKKSWMVVSISAIVLSVLSLLLPVLTYTSARTGRTTGYNIFSLVFNSDMVREVFGEYNGRFLYGLDYGFIGVLVFLLALIGITAIILAFVGIKSMAKQYESARPFKLAMCGLIGTAIPSVLLLILFLVSRNRYDGVMSLGAYIIITPVAMVLACLTVVNRHRLTQEEIRLQQEASAYIRPAGDLPEQ